MTYLFAKKYLKRRPEALILPASLYCVFVKFFNKENGTNYKLFEEYDSLNIDNVINIFKDLLKQKPVYISYYEKECFVGWEFTYDIEHPKYITIRRDLKIKKFLDKYVKTTGIKNDFITQDELIKKIIEFFYKETGINILRGAVIKYIQKLFQAKTVINGNFIGYQGYKLLYDE
jgi:hypothetical protein